MSEKFLFRSATAVAAVMLLMGTAQAQTTMETVPVGNLGNGADTRYDFNGFGAVDYHYSIGTYEVTAGQYVEFLNDVDPEGTNSDGLYNSSMDSSSYGCQITLNGTDYDFSGAPSGTAADWENRPVNYVSWYDAAMFANWLTSGDINQGAYDTSVGAGWGDSNASNYTGITPHNSPDMDALVATYGKVWVIPTEDEWYKAAYHKNDGDTANYWDYPTESDIAPTAESPSGTDLVNGSANYSDGGVVDGTYYRTEVGAYDTTDQGEYVSDSPYDTFDQGGNVWEWNETLIGSYRGLRGGSFALYDAFLRASIRSGINPPVEYTDYGFRVASIPEPGSITLLLCGLVAGLIWWRRRK